MVKFAHRPKRLSSSRLQPLYSEFQIHATMVTAVHLQSLSTTVVSRRHVVS